MPQFPSRDFTTQFISNSYQDVVQRYDSRTETYFLDGLGYVILGIPENSVGGVIVTQDQTVTSSISSSYSSYSELSNNSINSVNSINSEFVLTASTAIISQFASQSISSSYALSASWAQLPHVEKGIISGSNFYGTPQYFSVNYSQPFLNTNYVINIIGEDARIWSSNNRTTNSFDINSNSNQPISGMVSYRVEQI